MSVYKPALLAKTIKRSKYMKKRIFLSLFVAAFGFFITASDSYAKGGPGPLPQPTPKPTPVKMVGSPNQNAFTIRTK